MIPQILSIGSLLTQLAGNFGASKNATQAANSIIEGASKTYNTIATGNVAQSARYATISPMVAIENTLIHQDYMSDLLTVVALRDIKDTLTHFALQGEVKGIKISRLVESVNPRRAGLLSYSGLEAFDPSAKKAVMEGRVTVAGKTYADLTQYQPLALGRTCEASVNIDGHTVPFPLTFREIPVPISSNDLKEVFDAARPEDGMYGRWLMHKSGEITTPELLTGSDKIKREFNIRRNDMSGYYKEANKRASGNRAAAIRTGIISVNTEANTIIMSSETAKTIELEIGASFDGSGINRIRKAVLANNIIIVDDGLGSFTFYSSSSNIPERWTRKEITVASKKDTSLDLGALTKLFGGR